MSLGATNALFHRPVMLPKLASPACQKRKSSEAGQLWGFRSLRKSAWLSALTQQQESLLGADKKSSDNGTGGVFDRHISRVVRLAKDSRTSVVGFAVVEFGEGWASGSEQRARRHCDGPRVISPKEAINFCRKPGIFSRQ